VIVMTDSTRSKNVVSALVYGGLVAPDRAAEAEHLVETALGGPAAQRPARAKFGEIAGYLGAALVVAAGALFIAQEWSTLSPGGRVAWVGAMALILGVAGMAAAFVGGGYDFMRTDAGAVRRRLAGTILAGAAVAGAFTAALQVDRMDTDYSSWPSVAGMATLAVVGLLGYWIAPTAVGQVPVAVGLFSLVPSTLDAIYRDDTEFALTMSLIEIAIASLWWGLTEIDFWKPREIGLIIAFAIALIGSQMNVMEGSHENVGYLLTALVAVAAFGGYVLRPAWPYLAAGVIAVTILVPEAITDWTEGSIGTAGAVLLAGVTLLGASLASFRLHAGMTEDQVGDQQSPTVTG
jgi:hypothetical protein